MAALRVLPALAWTALIAWFSTNDWSAAETSRFLLPLLKHLLPWALPEQLNALHWLARKTAHATEYGVLAALWRWAMTTRGAFSTTIAPLGFCTATAALDELHQATTLMRTGSVGDVLLDTSGAAATLVLLTAGVREVARWLTGALLWTAAAGGTLLLAINWAAGAPSGWLWWSVPAAWIALAVWRLTGGLTRRGTSPPGVWPPSSHTSPQD